LHCFETLENDIRNDILIIHNFFLKITVLFIKLCVDSLKLFYIFNIYHFITLFTILDKFDKFIHTRYCRYISITIIDANNNDFDMILV